MAEKVLEVTAFEDATGVDGETSVSWMRKYLQELKRRNLAGSGASEDKQTEVWWSKMITFGRHF